MRNRSYTSGSESAYEDEDGEIFRPVRSKGIVKGSYVQGRLFQDPKGNSKFVLKPSQNAEKNQYDPSIQLEIKNRIAAWKRVYRVEPIVFTFDTSYRMILPYLEGTRLTCFRFDEQQFHSLAISLIQNIRQFHTNGLVILDIKHSNVIVSLTQECKIADLGSCTDIGQKLSSNYNVEPKTFYQKKSKSWHVAPECWNVVDLTGQYIPDAITKSRQLYSDSGVNFHTRKIAAFSMDIYSIGTLFIERWNAHIDKVNHPECLNRCVNIDPELRPTLDELEQEIGQLAVNYSRVSNSICTLKNLSIDYSGTIESLTQQTLAFENTLVEEESTITPCLDSLNIAKKWFAILNSKKNQLEIAKASIDHHTRLHSMQIDFSQCTDEASVVTKAREYTASVTAILNFARMSPWDVDNLNKITCAIADAEEAKKQALRLNATENDGDDDGYESAQPRF